MYFNLGNVHLWASPMVQWVKNWPAIQRTQETQVWFLVRKTSWKRKWQPTPVFLPEKSQWQWSLEVYSPEDCKELDVTEQLSMHPYVVYQFQFSLVHQSIFYIQKWLIIYSSTFKVGVIVSKWQMVNFILCKCVFLYVNNQDALF